MSAFNSYRHGLTRRDFLATASTAAAGALLGVPRLAAGEVLTTSIDTPRSAETFLDPSVPETLRTLASRAIDAAMHAGASYADVRIAEQQILAPQVNVIDRNVKIVSQCTFGVRARVNGIWGFAYGRVPTPDAVARCAEDAVRIARVSARLSGTGRAGDQDFPWTQAPIMTGDWRTPIQIDPFTVPLQQHGEILTALIMATGYVYGGLVDIKPTWGREMRVFAASSGSLLTQQRYTVTFDNNNYVAYGHHWIGLRVPELHGASAGYEILLNPALQDHIKAAAEEAEALTRLPQRPLEVGRYPVVFDGITMGAVLTHLVGPALELDRVMGDENDAVGTSPITIDQLGRPIASPLLTVTGHRAVPSITATRWDDEGVEARPHTVIRDGHLADFHTNGQTVVALQSWYQQHGHPVMSNGCAMATEAGHLPLLQAPHLTMTPATGNVSVQDLCTEMKRGILVVQQEWLAPDQQLASATVYTRVGASASDSVQAGGMMFEIAQGKIVRRIQHAALQCHTLPFLKSIVALGGPQTVQEGTTFVNKGVPWQFAMKGTTAPAALFKEINAISVDNR